MPPIEDAGGDATPATDDGATARPVEGYDARREARRLLRTARSGALATLTSDGDPYASLVTIASLPDGSPVVPLSTLAAHTRHVMADPRCSLLLERTAPGDPLTRSRLTLTGRAVEAAESERAAWRSRFLRRHPDAFYVDFGDFSFWRIEVASGRVIGGFGRINMLKAADLVTHTAGAEALLDAEERAVDHLNADHRDALGLYATALAGAREGNWHVVGLDPDGIDLACDEKDLRLDFPERVTEPGALRRQLVRWVEDARGAPTAG